MTRPLAYISAPWGTDNLENATNAASYCRQAYEAGYSPICPVLFMPTFLKGDAPAEVKDRQEMADELEISLQMYQRYEYGERDIRKMPMDLGLKMCYLLELNPFELVLGEDAGK